jgi:tetratricopeptide (TPR) repeat protein
VEIKGTADELFETGVAEYQKGNLEEALVYFQKVADFGYDSVALWYNMATVYRKLKQYGEATIAYRKALEGKRDSADIWYNLGRCYWETNQLDIAITCFEEVIKLQPKMFEALYRLAALYQAIDNIDKAIWANEELLIIEPQSFGSLTNLCVLYMKNNQLDKALENCLKADKILPDDLFVLALMGEIYLLKGNKKMAEKKLLDCLAVNSNYVKAKDLLEQVKKLK